tara:strand:- start:1094 stop:1318 length:225 start_codon:yes stop_codon:yes gene_type:complete
LGDNYGLDPKRLPRAPFTCIMCKQYYMGAFRYIWHTFEILPKSPSEELIICEKCALREGKFKTMKQLKEFYETI